MISIIIPIYNVIKYISRSLDSILNQSFQNLEVILVNDCSLANFRTIAVGFAQKDSSIKIIDNEKNSGTAWSIMIGYTNPNYNLRKPILYISLIKGIIKRLLSLDFNNLNKRYLQFKVQNIADYKKIIGNREQSKKKYLNFL
jgi:glycosyltransferase involved in cell wall biosynthesis